MDRLPVIAVFDVGKTNKKVFLFDRQYRIVYEQSRQLDETTDEDGFACEDVLALSKWVMDTCKAIFSLDGFEIKAINFSAYGASFVHLDEQGNVCTPLYNYLKPFPGKLQQQFDARYGTKQGLALATASPVLGNLNSGMQLYWLKHTRAADFSRIRFSLHLPQYLSFLLTGKYLTDLTSLGCHTGLWNFSENDYHSWVKKEHLTEKLAPLADGAATFAAGVLLPGVQEERVEVGIGLHDSSAALIPYLACFKEPFVLISTGTWSISLNPFNDLPLTVDQLSQDCLCYLSFQGNQVKASRIFAGHDHDVQVKRIASFFGVNEIFYAGIEYNEGIAGHNRQPSQPLQNDTADNYPTGGTTANLHSSGTTPNPRSGGTTPSAFMHRDLSIYPHAAAAYHQLVADIIAQQVVSTSLVISNSPVSSIFVDGGFAKNNIYMHLLAAAFPGINVCAASVSQASALGAALAIHRSWNTLDLPSDLVGLQHYRS